MLTTPKTVPRAKHAGFTLLEVLIALLVLSMGLLGLAALQTLGLRFNHQSYQRTQAVFQAYDMIDRIRANPTAKSNGNYNNVALGSTPSVVGIDCSTSCIPADLATFDINRWNTANSTSLTQGRGAICLGTFNSDLTSCTVAGNVFRVGLSWLEADVPMVMVVEAQL